MHLPKSRTRKLLFIAIYALFLGGLLMGAGRVYWRLHSGVPINEQPSVWDYYYPELRKSGVWDAQVSAHDDVYDVLLLGASALEKDWGTIEVELIQGLKDRLEGKQVRVFNLAKAAHTSRDSLFKHAQLSGKSFDLVIAYDGFNDIRMNAFPRDKFRDDYTHCSWYRGIEKRVAASKVNLVDAVKTEWELSLGLGAVDPVFFDEGRDIKTTGPFRNNLEALLADAKARGEQTLFMTIAWYIPADYSVQKFHDGRLDYSVIPNRKRCHVEMWGRPDLVRLNADAHNAVLRDFATSHPEVVFVDQEKDIAGSHDNFVDPCHFTDAGCRLFVANILRALQPRLKEFAASNHR